FRQHREDLVEVLLVLRHDEDGAAMLEQVADLAGSARRIDAIRDGPERLRREVGDGPLGTRIADDRDRFAARARVLARHAERHGGDALGELDPRGLAVDAELLRAARYAMGTRSRALDEQPGKSGSA